MNLANLGMQATLMGITGKDDANIQISRLLKKTKVTFKPLIDSKIRTTTKLRITGKNQQLMRIDHEDKDKTKIHKKLLTQILKVMKAHDAIIISDYDKGVVKPIINDILESASNQKEFNAIMGLSKTKNDFYKKAEKLRKKLKLSALLITEGKKGMTLFQSNKVTSYHAEQKDVFDVTGAGDTVISVLAASISSGKSLNAAVKLSNIAAGLSVQKLGAASVSQKELSNAGQK